MTEDYSRFFSVFTEVSKAIHQGENSSEILESIVTHIQDILKAKGAIFWIVDQSQEKIETMISHGFSYRNLAEMDYRTLMTIFDPEDGPYVHIRNAHHDRRIPNLDTIGKRSVGSVVGLFVDIVGSYTGILAVYFYGERDLSPGEHELLAALGEQGAIALQKAFSYDEKMVQNLRQMVEAFTLALEAKDERTHGHSVRVAQLAKLLAAEVGLSGSAAETIYHGGLLHDIGKIGMNDEILERLGILTRKERDIIKQHPVIGARITRPLVFLHDVVPLILHHHERFDGSGYPDGLKGEAIPMGARIMAVCDAFETMLAGRNYLKKMKLSDAIVNLRQGAGHHFDPALVDGLFAVIERNPEVVNLDEASIRCLRTFMKNIKKQVVQIPPLFI